ncbi:MAG TPA: hypothetical protein VKQ36_15225 [Ktedonobacterales bacterium]|nr:hypothetical protein [Ktedonobacterales bacterium]
MANLNEDFLAFFGFPRPPLPEYFRYRVVVRVGILDERIGVFVRQSILTGKDPPLEFFTRWEDALQQVFSPFCEHDRAILLARVAHRWEAHSNELILVAGFLSPEMTTAWQHYLICAVEASLQRAVWHVFGSNAIVLGVYIEDADNTEA